MPKYKIMKKGFIFLTVLVLSLPYSAFAQKTDSLIKKLDSLNKRTDTTGKQVNNTNPEVYNETTQFTFKSYFILLGSDLKQEFTKPFHMTHKDWVNFGEFALVAVGVGFADVPIQRNALIFRNNNAGIRNISKYVTNFGGPYEAYTLAAFGVYGFIFNNQKMKTTTFLATQAYITGAAMESVLKILTGRTRPSSYAAGTQARPRFLGPFTKIAKDVNGKTVGSSFPSGHTTVAFAAATVFAQEYKDKIYIPIIAYSAATLIGLSRITENKHWATDVLVGAALGYLTGKQVVNNYHRYAKIKAPAQKATVAFKLDYQFGKAMPGIVYTFRGGRNE